MLFLPFVVVILSLSLLPLMNLQQYQRHIFISAILCTLFMVWAYDLPIEMLGMSMKHYVPFLLTIQSLYILSSSMVVVIPLLPTPLGNMCFLLIATLSASFIGTLGASSIFIRSILKNNRIRPDIHYIIVVFFIILVCNIGGILTPLGDPPLLMGFINGVPFLWTFWNLWPGFLIFTVPILALYFFIDYKHYQIRHIPPIDKEKFYVKGAHNVLIFLVIICLIFVQHKMNIYVFCGAMVCVTAFAYFKTDPFVREENNFSWHSIIECAEVFLAIFITLVPINYYLSMNGVQPNMSPVLYLWLSGIMSGFLDNVPTYLTFFEMAGGSKADAAILKAISYGCVFMGALTYIGNAPNIIVRETAKNFGVDMPSFTRYFVYALLILIPPMCILSFTLIQ